MGGGVSIVRVSDLRVDIGGRPVVRGVNLELPAGTRTALLGASGSGKSITAAAVVGCLPPSCVARGSIEIAGHQVMRHPAARRPAAARAGMVFQNSSAALNPMVTVGRQLTGPLRRQGLSRPEAAGAAARLLAGVGLLDTERILRSHPSRLSGGQRQRVCLAMGLAGRVPLLVADEPTTALDVRTQAAVLAVLRARTGTPDDPALLLITHDVAVAAGLCDRLVVLHEGRVVEQGATRQILTAPTHPATVTLVDAARAVEADLRAALPSDGRPTRTAW